MLLTKRKYQFTHLTRKAGLTAIFILLTGLVYAQYDDEPAPDSVIVTEEFNTDDEDDTPIQQIDVPSSESYFDSKWEYVGNWDSLHNRKIPDQEVARLKNDDEFWYANFDFPKEKEEPEKKPSGRRRFNLSLYDAILWLITILGFVAFLVIYLMNSNVSMFRRTRDVGFEESDPDLDDIFGINYEKEIEKAINAGNHRLAVRLMFLRLLRNLTDKNIIQYKHDRTNFDYLMQLGNTKWYEPFSLVARHYEYVWYGKFAIDERQFNIIRNEFTILEKQL